MTFKGLETCLTKEQLGLDRGWHGSGLPAFPGTELSTSSRLQPGSVTTFRLHPSPCILLSSALPNCASHQSFVPASLSGSPNPLVKVIYASGPSPWAAWKGLSFPLCKMGMQTFVLLSLQDGGDLLGWPVEADKDVAFTVSLLSEN